jgi:hypothetical protein
MLGVSSSSMAGSRCFAYGSIISRNRRSSCLQQPLPFIIVAITAASPTARWARIFWRRYNLLSSWCVLHRLVLYIPNVEIGGGLAGEVLCRDMGKLC